ncbi:phage anti-repressor protein [Sporomusaceae bacterium BoRhaA]|uniref:antA/AntB antirepressor family protein n=1 Tax=Pelorhabdus rhamnosifermentans TaxID=2772457 RepID=UPI001C0623EC|nr:antA/AntB antirepressor family protein [Pelorhabdus rhamnosifermentans]MBU2701096.1 phage anti-repressor protein [Pelorhabdus rhamnosifermentans]
MNDLIKVDESGKPTAKELYEFLSPNDKSHYSRWAKTNIEDNEFYQKGVDWWGFATVANGNETKDYKLTIEFSKHLCMLSRTERGKQARNYFIEVEKRYKKIASPETVSLQAKAKNAEARLINARRKDAEFLLEVAKQSKTLSSESRELLTINAVERIAGEGFLPRPKVDKLYSATDIAEENGLSPNMVGRIATKNNLKIDQYGITVLDQSASSAKQIPSFRYNEAGRQALLKAIADA